MLRRLTLSAFAWRRAVLLRRQLLYPYGRRQLRLSLVVMVTLLLSAVRCRSVALAVSFSFAVFLRHRAVVAVVPAPTFIQRV